MFKNCCFGSGGPKRSSKTVSNGEGSTGDGTGGGGGVEGVERNDKGGSSGDGSIEVVDALPEGVRRGDSVGGVDKEPKQITAVEKPIKSAGDSGRSEAVALENGVVSGGCGIVDRGDGMDWPKIVMVL